MHHIHTHVHTRTHTHIKHQEVCQSHRNRHAHANANPCASPLKSTIYSMNIQKHKGYTQTIQKQSARAHTRTNARRVCVIAFPVTHTQLECSAEKCQNRRKGGRKEGNIIESKKKITQAEWEIRRKGKREKTVNCVC